MEHRKQMVVVEPGDTQEPKLSLEQVLQETLAEKEAHLAVVGLDGGKAGVLGGRPSILLEDKRGAGETEASNRLARGVKRRREDIDAFTGQAMCRWMENKARELGETGDLRRAACRRYEQPWGQVEAYL